MSRFAILAATAAAATFLAGCADFKATDKILRNDHRVIQKTRVLQQPAVVRVQQPTVSTVQVQQAPVQVLPTQVIQQQPIVLQQPVVNARTVSTTTVVQPQVIHLQTLTRVQVIELQRALAARGLYRAPIDGIFGIRTAQAMAAYQRSIGASGPVTATILEGLGLNFG